MDLFQPPKVLLDASPEPIKTFLENGGWYGVLGVAGLLVLLVVWGLLSRLLGGLFGRRKRETGSEDDLQEDVTALPPPPPATGDRRLTVEGVPVRVRLVVVAPAGRGYDINPGTIPQLLDRVLMGLGGFVEHDKPQIRIWPFQLSYEGFASKFHRNTPKPEGEDDPSPWVMVAGRARLGGNSVLIGLVLKAVKPTTVGRKTLEAHEWDEVLRIRTRE